MAEKPKNKTGTEKRDEKTKRQLSEAAADPRQSHLFERGPPSKAKPTDSATATSLASHLDQSTTHK